jgi:hypothetical protein
MPVSAAHHKAALLANPAMWAATTGKSRKRVALKCLGLITAEPKARAGTGNIRSARLKAGLDAWAVCDRQTCLQRSFWAVMIGSPPEGWKGAIFVCVPPSISNMAFHFDTGIYKGAPKQLS